MKVLVSRNYLTNIANSIRTNLLSSTTYTPEEKGFPWAVLTNKIRNKRG